MRRTLLAGLALALSIGLTGAPAQAETPTKPDRTSGLTPAPRVAPDPQVGRSMRSALGLAATSAPVVADGGYWMDVPNFNRYATADCEELLGELEVYTGSDTDEWYYADVEWNVVTGYGDNPGGGEIYEDGVYDFEALYWCPEMDGFGTFTVDMSITFYDWDGYVIDVVDLSDDFRVSRIAMTSSKVTFTKKKYRAHGWKWTAKVTRAGSPWRQKRVVLQAKVCGDWFEMTSGRTNQRGRKSFALTPKAGWNTERFCGVRGARIPFRFVVEGNHNTKSSVSSTFRVTRR